MSTAEANVAATVDQDRAIDTVTAAFISDPISRWAFRDAHQYLTYFPRLVRALAGGAFDSGTAHSVEAFSGVALWLPPGVNSDEEAMGALVEEGIPASEQEEMFGLLGQMDEYHLTDPHWYLSMIGVDPARQGRGYGSALLRHGLKTCDAQGVPAYLEATSERNKPLYERHGFEAIGVMQSGSSPPMWPMLRKPH
ncbi:MAG: GNAT family N-acetyltransferase [Pseudonocardiaceae bacterium]